VEEQPTLKARRAEEPDWRRVTTHKNIPSIKDIEEQLDEPAFDDDVHRPSDVEAANRLSTPRTAQDTGIGAYRISRPYSIIKRLLSIFTADEEMPVKLRRIQERTASSAMVDKEIQAESPSAEASEQMEYRYDLVYGRPRIMRVPRTTQADGQTSRDRRPQVQPPSKTQSAVDVGKRVQDRWGLKRPVPIRVTYPVPVERPDPIHRLRFDLVSPPCRPPGPRPHPIMRQALLIIPSPSNSDSSSPSVSCPSPDLPSLPSSSAYPPLLPGMESWPRPGRPATKAPQREREKSPVREEETVTKRVEVDSKPERHAAKAPQQEREKSPVHEEETVTRRVEVDSSRPKPGVTGLTPLERMRQMHQDWLTNRRADRALWEAKSAVKEEAHRKEMQKREEARMEIEKGRAEREEAFQARARQLKELREAREARDAAKKAKLESIDVCVMPVPSNISFSLFFFFFFFFFDSGC